MRGRAFVRLARLKFLIGGISGGAFGTAIAVYETRSLDVLAYVLAQLAITAAHLMTQFANDYYDRESDAITTRTPYSGGSGVLIDGSLAPIVALRAALACMALSIATAVALLATGRASAAIVGFAIVAFAWMYSAPPVRLLARGLGELDTALVVAVLVPLCAYTAQTHGFDARAIVSTLPGAVAMFVMMLCVQLPDFAADAATRKRNLVVSLGSERIACLGLASCAVFVCTVVATTRSGVPIAFVVLELLASVQVIWLVRAFRSSCTSSPVAAATIAGRGVRFFGSVSIVGALGYFLAIVARS